MFMLKNYLTTALRNMRRNKAVALINVFGLAVCMSIGLQVINVIKVSYSYDQFHPHPDRTYSVTSMGYYASGQNSLVGNPNLADEVRQYALVENAVTIVDGQVIANPKKQAIPLRSGYTDNRFFEVLGFSMIKGNPANALTAPNSLVLFESASAKLFSDTDPLGQSLTLKGLGEFIITGILADPDSRTNIQYDALISKSTYESIQSSKEGNNDSQSWHIGSSMPTYILLKEGVDEDEVNQLVHRIMDKSLQTINADQDIRSLTANIKPINAGMDATSVLAYVAFAGVFLLLAVFNYTNLTVARAFSRVREMGIRRVAGAHRSQIMIQIFVESTLISFVALVIAFYLTRYIYIEESAIVNIQDVDPELIAYAFLFTMGVGVLAGLFPGLVMSRISPVQALSRLFNTKFFSSMTIRNGLIISQFALSLVSLIVVLLLNNQFKFIRNMDRGFDATNKIIIPFQGADFHVLRSTLTQNPLISGIAVSSTVPGSAGYAPAVGESGNEIPVSLFFGDPQFISVWGLHLLAGKNFQEAPIQTNEQYAIVNKTFLSRFSMGSLQEGIGKFIGMDSLRLQIIGVVDDFSQSKLSLSSSPVVIRYNPDVFQVMAVHYLPGREQDVRNFINDTWHRYQPDTPLVSYSFEETFLHNPAEDRVIRDMSRLSVVAILISCLGLLGIVLYGMQLRRKEIAIRKVMGSSAARLMVFLSKGFFRSLAVAFCIGLPVGYLISDRLLSLLPVKAPFGVGIVFVSLVTMASIGLVVVCGITLKASLANPVNALKDE